MKLALVHDYLREWGGAEEVVAAWHDIWPDAPLYIAYYVNTLYRFTPPQTKIGQTSQSDELVERLHGIRLNTSWLQLLPDQCKTNMLTPLLPYAFDGFDFSSYDIVLSSVSAFAKTITVKKPTAHICYCHTPPRFLYGLQRERKRSKVLDIAEAPFDWWLRSIDQAAASSVDYFIAPSETVARRIKQYYKRDATVIYPPVDTNRFRTNVTPNAHKQYFVIIGRLSPIKQFHLAVEACTKLGIPLKVIGEGSEEAHLRSMAGNNVEFLGRLSNAKAAPIVAGARAVINPVFDEDFGIVPIEALACGVPVIAYASEAAKETMSEGVTGRLFEKPTVESLMEVLKTFDPSQYDTESLMAYASAFSIERFETQMSEFVDGVYNEKVKDQK